VKSISERKWPSGRVVKWSSGRKRSSRLLTLTLSSKRRGEGEEGKAVWHSANVHDCFRV
jgi:hypothetical protein